MKRKNAHKQVVLGLIITTALSLIDEPAFSEDAIYEWVAVQDATYYRGQYEIDGKVMRFRTSGTKLRLPSGSVVTIKAISAEQRLLQTLNPSSKAIDTPARPLANEAPEPVVEEFIEIPAVFPYTFSSGISIGLGFGKETLELEGDSSYKNKANVTGTRIDGLLQWEKPSHRLFIKFNGFVHKFIADSVILADGSDLGEKKFDRMRLNGTFTYERNFKSFGIGVGLGVASISGPIITVDRPNDKEGFSDTRSTIPLLHMTTGTKISDDTSFHLFLTTSFPKKEGIYAKELDVSVIKQLTSNIVIGAGLDSRKESISKDISCPSPFVCRSRTEMMSSLTYGYLFAGYQL